MIYKDCEFLMVDADGTNETPLLSSPTLSRIFSWTEPHIYLSAIKVKGNGLPRRYLRWTVCVVVLVGSAFLLQQSSRFILLKADKPTDISANETIRNPQAFQVLGVPPLTPRQRLIQTRAQHYSDTSASCDREERGHDALFSTLQEVCGPSTVGLFGPGALLLPEASVRHLNLTPTSNPKRYKKLYSHFQNEVRGTKPIWTLQDKSKRETSASPTSNGPAASTFQKMPFSMRFGTSGTFQSQPSFKHPISFSSEGASPLATTIKCMTLSPEIPQRFCRAKNLALRLDLVPSVIKGESLQPPFGTLLGVCNLDERKWFDGKVFGKGAAGWMFDSLRLFDPTAHDSANITCDAWIDTPLFFVDRWDTTNPYQAHQDMLNTFLAYAALDLDPTHIQPVLLDSRSTDGPYLSAWSHLFSSSHHIVDLRALTTLSKTYLHRTLRHPSPSPVICLRDATFGFHGGISKLSKGGNWMSACSHSPLLLAFRDFMLERFGRALGANALPVPANLSFPWEHARVGRKGAQGHPPAVLAPRSTRPPNTLTVTYAIRKSSTSRITLSDTLTIKDLATLLNSSSPTSASPTTIPRLDSIRRILGNEPDLIAALRTAALHLSTPDHPIHFRAVDFAGLPFEDQVAVARGTDVLVGPHGAVFVYLLYLRQAGGKGVRERTSGTLEILPPERRVGNFQFENLARRLDHHHMTAYVGNSASPEELDRITTTFTHLLKDLLGLPRPPSQFYRQRGYNSVLAGSPDNIYNAFGFVAQDKGGGAAAWFRRKKSDGTGAVPVGGGGGEDRWAAMRRLKGWRIGGAAAAAAAGRTAGVGPVRAWPDGEVRAPRTARAENP
ncbi:hypothetical protein HDU96_010578 [Phlyctochytrium bullatum]|nr:hypothetical protein HDU96_010578 [Phlyctochytrium bullatum]